MHAVPSEGTVALVEDLAAADVVPLEKDSSCLVSSEEDAAFGVADDAYIASQDCDVSG